MATVAKSVYATTTGLGSMLGGKHEWQVVLISQFSKVLLKCLLECKCTILLSAGKVLLSGLAPVLEMSQRYACSAESKDLVTASIFALLCSAQKTAVGWNCALWSRGGRNSCAVFFCLPSACLPGKAESLRVGEDPMVVGSTTGWEVREEQPCVICFFLVCNSCFCL